MLRNIGIALLIIIILGGGIFLLNSQKLAEKEKPQTTINSTTDTAKNMKLTSAAFENNQSIPSKYTCDGENVNPPLTISDIPENAKSLVLIVDDPDAPAGTWVHWLIWNIDPKTTGIAEDSVPNNSIQGKTSFGKPGYGGPCPPSGTHRYFFKLYALDITLSISNSSTKQDLENAMAGHILQKTEIVGLYSRKN